MRSSRGSGLLRLAMLAALLSASLSGCCLFLPNCGMGGGGHGGGGGPGGGGPGGGGGGPGRYMVEGGR